ncbi:MAG: alpha/beta fold hydrolase [Planctomycetota bacterium]
MSEPRLTLQHVQLADAALAVVDEGAGEPIVFLHGFPLDHSMWRHQAEFLASRYRVIVPDLRGFGQSDGVREVLTMEACADDVAQLLERLDITQPVTLVGLSMGGYVAFQFWRRHPQKLRRLVLCDTRSVADAPEVARGRLQMAERVLQEGSQVIAEGMIGRLLYESLPPQHRLLVDELRAVIERADPRAVAAAQRGMAVRPDVTAWLSEIRVPTLVLCGERDVISPREEMQALAAAIPASHWAAIPAAGHLPSLEQPAAVNQALLAFLLATRESL